jgi:hypothetical protein
MKPLLALLIAVGAAVMLARLSSPQIARGQDARLNSPQIARGQDACTSASFQGSYGYTFTGTTTDVTSYAATGRLVADGQGNLYGAETESLDGDIFQRTYTGRYSVNADCTGSEFTSDNFGLATRCDFVIVNGGREIHVIEADTGTVIVGCLKRQ